MQLTTKLAILVGVLICGFLVVRQYKKQSPGTAAPATLAPAPTPAPATPAPTPAPATPAPTATGTPTPAVTASPTPTVAA